MASVAVALGWWWRGWVGVHHWELDRGLDWELNWELAFLRVLQVAFLLVVLLQVVFL